MSSRIHDFLEALSKNKEKADFTQQLWISNAARKASQIRLVSHPAKFSHPTAQATAIIFHGEPQPDGYLRSGNVVLSKGKLDATGNAAALAVYSFLMLVLEDGRTVLEHFESSSPWLRNHLEVDEVTFDQWRDGFMAIKKCSTTIQSDYRLKQIYFPVEEGYHLLSILSPSMLISEQRHRIKERKIRFADVLLTQKLGGNYKQNISQINRENTGEVLLIPAFPPALKADYIKIPKHDFFKSLYLNDELKEIFNELHKLLKLNHNNLPIRQKRKDSLAQILEWVLCCALPLQQLPAGWSTREGVDLPLVQRQWLDAAYAESRAAWQSQIATKISQWILAQYRKFYSSDAVNLGLIEETAFAVEIEDYIQSKQEFIG